MFVLLLLENFNLVTFVVRVLLIWFQTEFKKLFDAFIMFKMFDMLLGVYKMFDKF